MCETLGALCSQFFHEKSDPFSIEQLATSSNQPIKMEIDEPLTSASNAFQQLLPRLLRKLESIVESNFQKGEEVQLIEILSAVCLQSMLGYFMHKYVLDVFEKVLMATNYWSQYRIARSASRYGHHFLAAKIYDKLSSNVSLEKLHFFLGGLSQISKAECILNHGCEYASIELNYAAMSPHVPKQNRPNILSVSERLEKAVTLYWKALATLKVTFILLYVRMRWLSVPVQLYSLNESG